MVSTENRNNIFLKERKLGTFCSLEAFYCNMHEAHCWHTNYISLHNLCWCLSAGKQDKSVSGPEPIRSFMAASFRFHPASDEAVTIVLGHSSDPLLRYCTFTRNYSIKAGIT